MHTTDFFPLISTERVLQREPLTGFRVPFATRLDPVAAAPQRRALPQPRAAL